MSKTSNIHLYTTATPNGLKITTALEELGLPYELTKIDISKNTQKEDWFRKINPNGRIPALTDTLPSTGQQIRLFESGSMLQYLVEQYDPEHKLSFPRGSAEAYEMNNWLWWQNAGLGPMQGQANHFVRYAPEKIQYGMNRYVNETRRLYGVLDAHLAASKSGYIVGDHISIADCTTIGWVAFAGWAGVDIDEFPHLKQWEERMMAREGVRKGMDIPDKMTIKETLKNKEEMERHAEEAAKWVQQGMREDAQKK